MKNNRLIKYTLIALIIDLIISWLYVYQYEKPDPSISIALISIAPTILVLNLIIGFIFHFFKNRFSKIFFINSILGPIIFYGIWSLWYDGYSSRYYIDYQFKSDNKLHELSLTKESDFFDISDISNQKSGFTSGLYFGKYKKYGDTIILTDDTVKMFIVDKMLIGFPNDKRPKIELEEQ